MAPHSTQGCMCMMYILGLAILFGAEAPNQDYFLPRWMCCVPLTQPTPQPPPPTPTGNPSFGHCSCSSSSRTISRAATPEHNHHRNSSSKVSRLRSRDGSCHHRSRSRSSLNRSCQCRPQLQPRRAAMECMAAVLPLSQLLTVPRTARARPCRPLIVHQRTRPQK